MSKSSLFTVIALTAISLFSFSRYSEAQVPAGKWWHMPGVAKKLELTDEHARQLDGLFVQNRMKLIDLKSALEKERFELQNLLDKDRLDEKVVLDQFARVQAARSKLDAERFYFLLEVRKILGLERFQHLEMLVKDFREDFNKRQGQGQRSMQRFGSDQRIE
jgi:Spy/CpxP family protein refolding chaperone